jgi:hypothetical protein
MPSAETLTTNALTAARGRMATALPDEAPLNSVDQVRRKLLANKVRLDVLAESLGLQSRTVYNYCEAGLPFIKVDGLRWFDVDVAFEWLTRRKDSLPAAPEPLPPPRPVGRPRRLTKSTPR